MLLTLFVRLFVLAITVRPVAAVDAIAVLSVIVTLVDSFLLFSRCICSNWTCSNVRAADSFKGTLLDDSFLSNCITAFGITYWFNGWFWESFATAGSPSEVVRDKELVNNYETINIYLNLRVLTIVTFLHKNQSKYSYFRSDTNNFSKEKLFQAIMYTFFRKFK